MGFVKIANSVVNMANIRMVEEPVASLRNNTWLLRTSLDYMLDDKSSFIIESFDNKESAYEEYERIVSQLCADK